ncbi:MAG: hypothetical protein GC171_07250 [Terrimonas sp.]|nr:hypothetical protein [Terrimonas sp.]
MRINTMKRISVLLCVFFLWVHQGSAQSNLKLKYRNSNVFAGIEVGSKGVKFSLIEIGKNAKTSGAFNPLKDSTVNTDFISFTQPTFDATLDAITGLYQTARNVYDIPSKRVFTVISSGVKVQAEKENKNDWVSSFIDSFRIRIDDSRRDVPVIDVTGEARLSHLGIVPDSRRFTTFLIDIGSGNTKGGYFPYGNTDDFKLYELTWGTKSTANAAEKASGDDNSLDNFRKQLNRVLAGVENNEIIYSINASGAYPLSDNVAFSGGISWALATLMHPEKIDETVVSVTFDEVVKFSDRLYRQYKTVSDSALVSNIKDPLLDKAVIAKNVKTVNKVFDQRSMLAGTGLLLKIMRQFSSIYESKQFFLVKNGQVGWISAYVDETINTD